MNDLILMKEDFDKLFKFMKMMDFSVDPFNEKHFIRQVGNNYNYLTNDDAYNTIGKLLDIDKNGKFTYAENLFYTPNDGRISSIKTSRGYMKVEQRKDTDTFLVRCFYIDIDIKDENGKPYKDDNILNQKKFELKLKLTSLWKDGTLLKPSMVVESKNGYHIYYILNEQYRIYSNMTKDEIRDFHLQGYDYQKNLDIKEWKCIEQSIYCAYNNHIIETDPKVTSPMHLLRLPGSIHKKEGQNPFRVKIVFIAEQYTLFDLKKAFHVDIRSTISDAPLDLSNVDVHMLAENIAKNVNLEKRKGYALWQGDLIRDKQAHNRMIKEIQKGTQTTGFIIPQDVYQQIADANVCQQQEKQLENSVIITDEIIKELNEYHNKLSNESDVNQDLLSKKTDFVPLVNRITHIEDVNDKEVVNSYLKKKKVTISKDVDRKQKALNELCLTPLGEAIKNRDMEFFKDKIYAKKTSLNFNDTINFVKQYDIVDFFDMNLDDNEFCSSPFRDDNKPSLHVSLKNGVYLFYDNAYPDIFSGTIIDIVKNLADCDNKEAIMFCAQLFNVEITNHKYSDEEYQRITEQNLQLIDEVIKHNQEQFKIVEDMLCEDSKDKKYKFLKKLELIYFDFLDLWKERVLKYPHIDIFELEVQVADFFISKRLKRKTSDKAIKQLEGMGLIKKIEQVQKEDDQTAPANKFYFRKIDSKTLDVRCERMRELCKLSEDELAKKKEKEIREGQGKINYINNKIVAQLEEEFK
jgi:hypothetical protein